MMYARMCISCRYFLLILHFNVLLCFHVYIALYPCPLFEFILPSCALMIPNYKQYQGMKFTNRFPLEQGLKFWQIQILIGFSATQTGTHYKKMTPCDFEKYQLIFYVLSIVLKYADWTWYQ